MPQPKTLLQLAGADPKPLALGDAAVLVIDAQMEYVNGAVPLVGVEAALDQIAALLRRARAQGRPVVHVRHQGRPGGLFDPDAERGAIAPQAVPVGDEPVVAKTLPSAFAGTDLDAVIQRLGVESLLVTGFMTHMCVSTTVRAALDRGIPCTVIASACATRDLPDGHGKVVPAAQIHQVELAALADRFCTVVDSVDRIGA